MKRLKKIFFYALIAAAVTGVSSNHQSFAVEPENQSVVVDTTVSLPCRVANLAGQLQWTKDDFALGTNRNLSYHGYPRYTMTGSDSNGKFTLVTTPRTSLVGKSVYGVRFDHTDSCAASGLLVHI